MSITKNIKCTDENTSKFIKQILNIKDSHISFSKDAISKKIVHGRMAKVFTGILTGEAHHCECCGFDSVIRHSYQDSWIQLIPYQEVPTYLHLYKQRFRCTQCHHTFSAKTYYVAENCYISQSLKFAIAMDLKKKISMKDIARRYFVSTKTVERILDSFFEEPRKKPNYLPKHLLIDEFKGTSDCEGAMCFIISDADTGKIFDILDDRRNFKLRAYFQRFTLKARKRVTHIVMDMNASYDAVTKGVFPNAQISIDRFHVIQQITRAFNKQRIQTMNQLKKSNPQAQKDYRKLKKYWRTLLKKNAKLNYTSFKQFPLFQRRYLTESEVLDYLLSIDDQLRQSYEVYQELLAAFDAKDSTEFFNLIESLPHSLNDEFKKAIRYLRKHKEAITNSLKYPYSNGKLEGKNNLIKVIKRIAFGFRTFRHLRMRVLIQQSICEII
ncbi:ISL3 family transposase [Enterococcus durans]|uniref:ISL3 family transposase n=1 Tax=Enterococcus durans TaxID=53345 RepID=UPI00189EB3B0|nr:ISL3 family transposase [Enterococcus durans]EHV9021643.1 ISL3 family transposase [Listeria monocytogenes]EHV9021907.1 ISL3 family transposase [Listeria monocytogenes]MDB1684416.1 ISL3 family transposase [Enterococcus durans]